MKIRYRLFCLVSVLLIIISGVCLWGRYNNYKQLLLQSVDDKLFMAAMVAHAGLPHPDSGEGKDITAPFKEHSDRILKKYKHLNSELGTDYLWSIHENNKTSYFLTSASNEDGSDKKSKDLDALMHSDAYLKAFLTMTPQYQAINDSKTHLRLILVPFSVNADSRYSVGASIRLDDVEDLLQKKMKQSLAVIPGIIFFSGLISLFIMWQFGKPFGLLNAELVQINEKRGSGMVQGKGLCEYSELADNVNRMINACNEKTESLTISKVNLDVERQQLFSIFQGIDEDIYIVDPVSLEILFINRPVGDNLPAVLIGKSCYKEIYGFDRPCEFCTNDIILRKKPAPHRWDYYDPKRQKYFAMIDRAIKWPDGRDVCFHFAIDITARKLSEEKIQNLFERSQKQAEELAARQKDLRLVNEGLEIQTEALIQSEADLKARQEELAHTNRVLSEQSSQLEEQKRHLNDKNTALEKAKKEVDQKAVELENTSRYKSDFLANMSHELRTPLNSILLLSRYLAEDSKDNLSKKQKECAETVYSSGNELLSLINEVLDLARVESGNMVLEPADTNINALVDDLEKKFRLVAEERGVGFIIHVDDALPDSIRTDPLRLGQILRNLLSNAFKFTEKGSVSFEVSFREEGLPVVFTVKDTGEGIEKDKQELVFQAFKQADGSTSRKYGGTGLGLSISREYANALRGTLNLISTVGIGSAFSLAMPVDVEITTIQDSPDMSQIRKVEALPDSEKRDISESATYEERTDDFQVVLDDRAESAKGSGFILIIETNQDIAGKIRNVVREQGYCALVAETGETGLFLTEVYSPVGIIMNMELAAMPGKTVLFRLKDSLLTRHIPVVVAPDGGRFLEPMKMGAMGLLSKNAEDAEIKEVIGQIEQVISTESKKILIIEDPPPAQEAISTLIDKESVQTVVVSTGDEARIKLSREHFDCVILDPGLPDIAGGDLLVKLRKADGNYVPVIVFTSQELSPDDLSLLDNYSNRIVIKGYKAKEKLLDATALYLHLAIANLPEVEHNMITKLYDRVAILEGKKVLIADDDMRNVFSLISVLEDKGIEIIVAKTGKEALTVLRDNPDTDIVLMDIMMPEMDGYEAIKGIRMMDGGLGRVPVIALTARAMRGDRARCIKVGANDYISKPVEADKLVSMLRVWLY